MTRVRFSIDKIVLKGFESGDARSVAEGLQRELARLLSDPAARAEMTRSHRVPVLRLGRLPLEPGSSGGKAFGGKMARAIGKGLKP